MLQLLPSEYLDDREESPAWAPDEVARIDMFAGDLYSEAGWDLSDMTGGPEYGSRASIRVDYGRLREAWPVVPSSFLLSVEDFLFLVTNGVISSVGHPCW